MVITINLFEKRKSVLTLQKGCYDIYLSGGYRVSTGSRFKLEMYDTVSDEKIDLKPVTRYRDKRNGLRVVKIYRMDIPESGTYTLHIVHPEAVKVSKSMLFSMNLLLGSPDDSQINLMIERSYYG